MRLRKLSILFLFSFSLFAQSSGSGPGKNLTGQICSASVIIAAATNTYSYALENPVTNPKQVTLSSFTLTGAFTTITNISLELNSTVPETGSVAPATAVAPSKGTCNAVPYYNSSLINTSKSLGIYTMGPGNGKISIDLSYINWPAGVAGQSIVVRTNSTTATMSYNFIWTEN